LKTNINNIEEVKITALTEVQDLNTQIILFKIKEDKLKDELTFENEGKLKVT